MTNEEAIKELKDASDSEVRYGDTKRHYDEVMKRIEAFDMAIKALEAQHQCDIAKIAEKTATFMAEHYTGKWVEKEDYNLDTYYECSKCGADYCIEGDILIHKYCPNCGAKMDGVETEVEDER